VLLCVGGKTRGAVRVCLEFLAPPFASRQKVEKLKSLELIASSKEVTVRCRVKPGMTAQEKER
jgi:hypothetical protein